MLFGISLPLGILGVLELALRVSGGSSIDPVFHSIQDRGVEKWTREPGYANLAGERPHAVDRIACAPRKSEGVTRLVVVGESTAAGFPFYPYLSFGRVVECLLVEEGWQRVEVVNLGKAADSSDRVREVVEAARGLSPDGCLLYCGHNDFQIPYCNELRENSSLLGGLATRLHLVRWLIRKMPSAEVTASQAPRLPSGRLVGDEPFLTELDKKRGERRFRQNMTEMVDALQDSRSAVFLMTQACNLKDFAPSYSAFTKELSEAQRHDYHTGLEAAESRNNDAGQIVDTLQKLVQWDEGVAKTHFLLAQEFERQERSEQARSAYLEALQRDSYPNRANRAFNQVIREVAQESAATLIDVEARLFDVSAGPAPGRDLFLDHCHPNLRATFILAQQVVVALRPWLESRGTPRDPPASGLPDFSAPGLRNWDPWLERLGLDREFLAQRSLPAARLNLLAYLESPTSSGPRELAKLGFQYTLEVAPNNAEARVGMALVAVLEGDRETALEESARAREVAPEIFEKVAALVAGAPVLEQALRSLNLTIDGEGLVPRR